MRLLAAYTVLFGALFIVACMILRHRTDRMYSAEYRIEELESRPHVAAVIVERKAPRDTLDFGMDGRPVTSGPQITLTDTVLINCADSLTWIDARHGDARVIR